MEEQSKYAFGVDVGTENVRAVALEVKGEDVKEKHFIRHERFSSNCERSYYLEKANENEIHAKLDNGVLNITVMKKNQEIQNKNVISIE
jgi:HSP20 family molecular chaperone IbpA